MFYHQPTNQYITEGQPFTINGVQYPANWLNLSTPEDKELLGLTEVVTVGTREDDKYFWVSETLEGSIRTIVNTPKDPEQIAAMVRAEKQAEIDRLEATSLLPRVTREFMLIAFEAQAAAAGVDPTTNFAYTKVKELDDSIKVLRSAL